MGRLQKIGLLSWISMTYMCSVGQSRTWKRELRVAIPSVVYKDPVPQSANRIFDNALAQARFEQAAEMVARSSQPGADINWARRQLLLFAAGNVAQVRHFISKHVRLLREKYGMHDIQEIMRTFDAHDRLYVALMYLVHHDQEHLIAVQASIWHLQNNSLQRPEHIKRMLLEAIKCDYPYVLEKTLNIVYIKHALSITSKVELLCAAQDVRTNKVIAFLRKHNCL